LAETSQDGVMIVLAAPGIARYPAAARVFGSGRIGMGGVVIEGADNYAAGPGSDAGERRPLQFAGIIARLHVPHLAVMSGGDPRGKRFDFLELADGGDPAQVESGLAGEVFDAGWKAGRH